MRKTAFAVALLLSSAAFAQSTTTTTTTAQPEVDVDADVSVQPDGDLDVDADVDVDTETTTTTTTTMPGNTTSQTTTATHGTAHTAHTATSHTTMAGGMVVAPGNTSPERDARGIPVISDAAVAPSGWNGGAAGTGMGGPMVDPATGAAAGADRSHPPCTATRTDNCVQTYERGRR